MADVKLQQIDAAGKPTKSFDIEQAQRMLNVKHPMKGWVLADDSYTLVKGVITAKQNSVLVTQKMLDENPALKTEGLKVGDPLPVKAAKSN